MTITLFGDDAAVTSISRNAFAKLVGVTEGAIRKAIARGEISAEAIIRLPSGKTVLHEAIALQQWRATHAGGAEDEGERNEYSRLKVQILQADLEARQIELGYKKREYLRADEVREVFGKMVGHSRAKILALEGKLMAQLAGDGAEVSRIVRPLIHEVLHELADFDPSQFRRERRNKGKV